jgi:Flp pilus assembly protein TadG
MCRRLRETRGASAVEFALLLPLLVTLVLGTVEFGHAFQVQSTLSAAAREAARTMALQDDPAAARTAVQGAASVLTPAVTDTQVTVAPATCPAAGGGTVTVTVRYPMPFLTGLFGASLTLTGTGVMRCNG